MTCCLEGNELICPWTARRIVQGDRYDLDHLLPISVYPINELLNLMPSDPSFNRYTKRNLLPSLERLQQVRPHLEWDYERYGLSTALAQALQEDVSIRFSTLNVSNRLSFPGVVTDVVMNLIKQIAEPRNLARFR